MEKLRADLHATHFPFKCFVFLLSRRLLQHFTGFCRVFPTFARDLPSYFKFGWNIVRQKFFQIKSSAFKGAYFEFEAFSYDMSIFVGKIRLKGGLGAEKFIFEGFPERLEG